ncbi:MAG TPA: GntR family transcriptional regulator [Casimicrobiaceae bacterium]|nr:GntR family transcriptional regulator [Casimicrobiaceae bacterium]
MDAPRTLSQTICSTLAGEIIRREIAPGARLDEQSLASRFGVSRSPVRDALRQLATTRLVDYVPHRGFSVVAVDHAELDGLFEASGEIETLCARLCALRAGPAERKRIELIHQGAAKATVAGDDKVYSTLNEDLHQAIFQGAHNKTLAEVAQTLRQRLAPFRSRMFFAADHRMAASHDEHGVLVRAVLAQDADGAAQAMREHAANSAINALQRLGQETGMAAPADVSSEGVDAGAKPTKVSGA